MTPNETVLRYLNRTKSYLARGRKGQRKNYMNPLHLYHEIVELFPFLRYLFTFETGPATPMIRQVKSIYLEK